MIILFIQKIYDISGRITTRGKVLVHCEFCGKVFYVKCKTHETATTLGVTFLCDDEKCRRKNATKNTMKKRARRVACGLDRD